MSTRIIVSGISGGSAPNRREINDLVRDEKQFSLYVQALQRMYTGNPQTFPTSFFQIAGIHGLPYVPWGGSTGTAPFNPATQWGGYCVHGSVLFPTWHRPYMALFEQTLWRHAQDIAAQYTVDREEWQRAAADLRQPYWDWATNAVPPAEVIERQQVTITNSRGQRVSVPNPLLAYRFQPMEPTFPRMYQQWPTTLRQPTSGGPGASSNVARLRTVLRRAQPGITTSTFNMLTRVRRWPEFSSHTVSDGGSDSNSIEIIHDLIHGLVGGHMGDPGVAAFDPLFFLHHTNVDRLLSLWTAMNPGVGVSPGDSEDGSFTLRPEVPVNRDTPLTPFWNTETTYWASSNVTTTERFGYTYPEFNGLDMGNAQAVRTAISRIITRLYGGTTAIPRLASFVSGADSAQKPIPASRTKAALRTPAAESRAADAVEPKSNGEAHEDDNEVNFEVNPGGQPGDIWEWTARVEFKKYELGTSFYVLLFLGAVPDDENSEEWLTNENLVGCHYAFVNSAASSCANCRGQVNIVEEGFVSLTKGILQKSGLSDLSPDVVEPYLTSELSWRIQKADGTPVDLEDLEVTVVATPMTLPPGAELPVPGERRKCPGITHGQKGGSRQGSSLR
ncbi:tyrosinase [Coprinopsis cinerea okayama7|uniref:tyrosinase n=1 Tax=Coprinopsis cinerea (strain Okayama-7 / 130 / ATCC MYA-4618 / FGSC 9003) TaxID=240176 RepID=D6RL64_COPC7|nr:tyrosinase [Coprinopsis cinerea okayama7\|eukprot:XP_002911630.1 tyrosinase [Coprinopsis cinerea okayama7\